MSVQQEGQVQPGDEPQIPGSSSVVDDVTGRGPEGSPLSDAEVEAGGAATPVPAEAPVAETPAPTQAEPAQSWQSIREAAEQAYRVQFPADVKDDRQALAYLVEQARQADVYAQIGRQVAPHAREVQEFIASKQKPAAAPEPSPWDRPEWDERWARLVEADPETGLVVGKAGTPPAIVDAANKYLEWNRRIQRDPAGYHEHLFNQKFMPKVQELVAEERAKIQQQTVVEGILAKNASWLYAKDDAGQYMRGADGNPSLSQAGVRYSQIVQEIRQYGVTDPRALDTLAIRQLQAEITLAQQAKAPPAPQAATQHAQNQPNRNASGTLPSRERIADPAAARPSGAGLSLAEQMRRSMADLKDSDFRLEG